MVKPGGTLQIGIVVERRDSHHPWQDNVWRAVDSIDHTVDLAVAHAEWTLLAEHGAVSRYFFGTLTLELHRRDCEGYLSNLSQPVPQLFVISRFDARSRLAPALVTANPQEAEVYEVDGDDQIDAIPMSPHQIDIVREFVNRHYSSEPFVKRKRKPHIDAAAPPPKKGTVGGPRFG